jgi:hypothetical protein
MEQTLDDMNIKHFKLSSGDEVLGLVAGVSKEQGVIHLEYPVQLEFIKHRGKLNYMMSDYMPTSKQGIVSFHYHSIVAQSAVEDSVKEEYVRYCINDDTDQSFEDTEYEDELDAIFNKPDDPKKYH